MVTESGARAASEALMDARETLDEVRPWLHLLTEFTFLASVAGGTEARCAPCAYEGLYHAAEAVAMAWDAIASSVGEASRALRSDGDETRR